MINDSWEKFLTEYHARLINDNISDFGNVAEETEITTHGDIITWLSHLALLILSGKDVVDFLHNLFTTDIKQLEENILQLSAWCNAKGQVVCDFYLYKQGESVNILIDKTVQDLFIRKIKLYILRAEVNIVVEDNKILTGIKMESEIPPVKALSYLPAKSGNVYNNNNSTYIRLYGAKHRYIIIDDIKNTATFWQAVKSALVMVGNRQWKILDILDGIAWITEKSSEQFIPQFINLDYLDAIDFQKGCFPGQEIIARLHYRSRPGKRTYLLKTSHITDADIGDRIHSKLSDNPVGRIINIEKLDGDSEIILAVIENEAVQKNKIFIGNDPDNPVLIESMPYTVNA